MTPRRAARPGGDVGRTYRCVSRLGFDLSRYPGAWSGSCRRCWRWVSASCAPGSCWRRSPGGPARARHPARAAAAAAVRRGGQGAAADRRQRRGCAVAEQTVPSGLAALLVAEVPLWLVCLRLLAGYRRAAPPSRRHRAGFRGHRHPRAARQPPGGHRAVGDHVLIIGATLCWSSGTFATRALAMPSHPFVAATYEMVTVGVVLLAAGAAAWSSPAGCTWPPSRRGPGWRWRT